MRTARPDPAAAGSARRERYGETTRIDVPGSLTLDELDMMAQTSRAGIGLAYRRVEGS
jgi:hypothetical protein